MNRTRRPLLRLLFLVVALAPATSGAARTLPERAAAYAKRHNLPTKRVTMNVAGKKLTRLVVPVLPETVADFARQFNYRNGAVVVRQSDADLIHQSLLFANGDGYTYGYGSSYWPSQQRLGLKDAEADHPSWSTNNPGRYVVLQLTRPEITGLRKFLTRGEQGRRQPANCPNGGCIWWLVHAEVGGGKPLAWAIGVRRSKDPSGLTQKFIHAGNRRVSVIGVAADSRKAFRAMSNAELLGAPPPMGVAEAVKER